MLILCNNKALIVTTNLWPVLILPKIPKRNLPVPVALGDRATKCSHVPSCQLRKKGNHLQLGGKTDSQER